MPPRTPSLPGSLVSTRWLCDHLEEPDLRVLDCSALPGGHDVEGNPLYDGGRAHWEAGHIPNSAFADLRVDLADQRSLWAFAVPPAQRFADAMEALGVGDGTYVVVYDADQSVQAARLWWLLRRFGFDDVAILDGGWTSWIAEGRHVSTDPPPARRARFTVAERPHFEADRAEVLAAINHADTHIVDAVPPEHYAGDGETPWYNFGRPGHIATAVNLSGRDAVAKHGRYRIDELAEEVKALGVRSDQRVITYCGVGVAACAAAFVLHLNGIEDVAVYDASLQEWAADPTLPMTTGEAA